MYRPVSHYEDTASPPRAKLACLAVLPLRARCGVFSYHLSKKIPRVESSFSTLGKQTLQRWSHSFPKEERLPLSIASLSLLVVELPCRGVEKGTGWSFSPQDIGRLLAYLRLCRAAVVGGRMLMSVIFITFVAKR